MISYVVQEKELRQKEFMKMMSVTECDIGWSWFCTFMIFNVVSASLATLVSSFLFLHSSPSLLWIFWMLTFLSITIFCTALAACCSKATRGVLLGLLVYFSGVFIALAFSPGVSSPWVMTLVTLHPVTTFYFGFSLLGAMEDINIGVSLHDLQRTEARLNYSMSTNLLDFVHCIIVWTFLTWYLNRVITPEYGRALPVWFPFSPAYWRHYCGHHGKGLDSDAASSTTVLSNDDVEANGGVSALPIRDISSSIPVEPVSDALRRQSEEGNSIEIVNLRKSFGDKTAVDGLNLSMYCGQITALLGHNGASIICFHNSNYRPPFGIESNSTPFHLWLLMRRSGEDYHHQHANRRRGCNVGYCYRSRQGYQNAHARDPPRCRHMHAT